VSGKGQKFAWRPIHRRLQTGSAGSRGYAWPSRALRCEKARSRSLLLAAVAVGARVDRTAWVGSRTHRTHPSTQEDAPNPRLSAGQHA